MLETTSEGRWTAFGFPGFIPDGIGSALMSSDSDDILNHMELI
jgi:hypothetical protein